MPLLEILPIIAFFISYKFKGLVFATGVLVVLSIITLAISYFKNGKVSKAMIFSTVILVTFGSLTIFSGNATFIKIKPTILNVFFGVILLVGIFRNKGLIKHLFGTMFNAPEEIWIKISKQWAIFFFVIAALNEIIWRNFSEEAWVNFKTFGFMPLSIILILMQFPILKKYSKEKIK